ncbi:MAG: glycoside hydrolase family 10 protein [Kiritimatiellia bacterium]
MQHDAKGKEKLWMNPAHPANRRHHFDLIREILASYDVDGIHLDYIRYPGGEWCYSAYTRQRFEAETGIMTATWPADVLDGGRHQDTFKAWRASVITSFVRETRELVRAQKPGTKLSAAVWGGYPQIISSIGQDWGAWIKEDLLDFVTPMNYANDLYRFNALLDQQLQIPGARGRIYPGIGVTANESRLSGDQVVEQILALRQRGMGGFALFDLSQTLVDETLPTLRLGITRP